MRLQPAWTASALEVVERACAYYGGVDRWRALACIRLKPGKLKGLVPWLKGYGRTFAFTGPFEIAPVARVARFRSYPDERHVGVFDNGAVRLERQDGAVVAESPNHRQTFRGPARRRRWSELDALYFFGYALTHYHAVPFTLCDGRLLSAERSGRGDDALDVLSIEFPSDLPTHGPRQRFYIDARGRIVRHDYHAEIVGVWAHGAHFWKRETRCGGFPIALERHVYARLGSVALPFTALHATFCEAEVEFDARSAR